MNYLKRKRRCLLSLLIVIMIFIFNGCANKIDNDNSSSTSLNDIKVTEATEDFYVNDFANILSDEQKTEMMDRAINLDENYSGIQVVVTTVESLDECVENGNLTSIEEVAYAMYSQYEIGQNDMGILVLFSEGDREVYLSTGNEMQVYITDVKSGKLLDDYAIEYFREDKFAEGLVSLQKAIIEEVQNIVPSEWNETNVIGNLEASKENRKETSVMTIAVSIIAVILAIITIILLRKLSNYKNQVKECDEKSNKRIKEAKSDQVEKLQKVVTKYDSELIDLKAENENIKEQNTSLKEELDKLQQKYERIQKLCPDRDFETEIQEMMEKEFRDEAERIDTHISKSIDGHIVDKDNVLVFKEAIDLYKSVNPDVKKYLKTDIEKIQELYNNSLQLLEEFETKEKEKHDKRATLEAEEKINSIINRIYTTNEDCLNSLEHAISYYNDLSIAQQEYFNVELLRKIHRMKYEAEENHRRKEQMRRESLHRQFTPPPHIGDFYGVQSRPSRPSRPSMPSRPSTPNRPSRPSVSSRPSNSSSTISRSGHGGRPSGGGAKRKF